MSRLNIAINSVTDKKKMETAFRIQKLSQDTDLGSFNSTDAELNDFLLEEAKDYQKELLAVTYIVVDKQTERIAAYYSLLNDTIRFGEGDKAVRNRINRRIPHSKQRNSYPAIKLGRLAVDKQYAGEGLGKRLLYDIAYRYSSGYGSGCRFVTVDAVTSALGFYEHFGFKLFSAKDAEEDTRQMYFDLKNVTI